MERQIGLSHQRPTDLSGDTCCRSVELRGGKAPLCGEDPAAVMCRSMDMQHRSEYS